MDYSVAKGNTIKERAIKNQRVSPSSFFLSLSPSFSYTICVCPSIYLPVHLYLSRFLRLPFRWPFRPLHRPSIKVPRRARYRCVQVHIRECLCVYTTRWDPSLVRSHFKHLLYHDRSLARCSTGASVSCSRSPELREKTSGRWNETSMVPRHELKTHSQRYTPRLRLLLLARRRFYVCGMHGDGLTSISSRFRKTTNRLDY